MITYTLKLPEDYVPPPLPGRDLWTAALRSGKYKQGKLALCKDDNHCCLGVLSKIQGRLTYHDGKESYVDELLYEFGLGSSNPVHAVLKRMGQFPSGVAVILHDLMNIRSLAALNDYGLTFNQIADVIEQVWSNAEPNWKHDNSASANTPSAE